MRHARAIAVLALSVLAAAGAAQACGGNSDASSFSAGRADPGGDPSSNPGITPDVVQPPIDSGPDGETVNDGGSNYPDGGEDAGECPIPLDLIDDDPTIDPSDCTSVVPQAQLQGGALVEGKYHLKATHALAPRAFCQTQFQPVPLTGTLTLVQADGGVRWVFEVVFASGGNERRTRALLVPAAGNTSPLQADPVCPDRPPGAVRFGSQLVTNDGASTQRLAILLPYGNGGAVYVFEKVP